MIPASKEVKSSEKYINFWKGTKRIRPIDDKNKTKTQAMNKELRGSHQKLSKTSLFREESSQRRKLEDEY